MKKKTCRDTRALLTLHFMYETYRIIQGLIVFYLTVLLIYFLSICAYVQGNLLIVLRLRARMFDNVLEKTGPVLFPKLIISYVNIPDTRTTHLKA